jgi:hypothetical protein
MNMGLGVRESGFGGWELGVVVVVVVGGGGGMMHLRMALLEDLCHTGWCAGGAQCPHLQA